MVRRGGYFLLSANMGQQLSNIGPTIFSDLVWHISNSDLQFNDHQPLAIKLFCPLVQPSNNRWLKLLCYLIFPKVQRVFLWLRKNPYLRIQFFKIWLLHSVKELLRCKRTTHVIIENLRSTDYYCVWNQSDTFLKAN